MGRALVQRAKTALGTAGLSARSTATDDSAQIDRPAAKRTPTIDGQIGRRYRILVWPNDDREVEVALGTAKTKRGKKTNTNSSSSNTIEVGGNNNGERNIREEGEKQQAENGGGMTGPS